MQAATARGLVSWWRAMPPTSGGQQWYDLLGRAPLTLTNMTSADTSGTTATARPGGAGEVRFDGTDDYAVTQVDARLLPAEATYTLWVKRTATGESLQVLWGAATGAGDREVFVKNSGVLGYAITFTTGNFSGDFTGPTLAVGTWYHVAVQHSAARGFQLHVNCVLAQAFGVDGSTFVPLTRALMFGAHEGIGAFLTGAMDDIRVYNRALSDAELCQIVRESSAGEPRLLPPPALVGLVAPALPTGGKRGSFFNFFQAQ
jgi:sialidase-1